MLLFVYYMICWGFKNSVIRKFPITEILLAKRKRYDSTLNLTLMTVIIYTGNKVKSNRGGEENQPTGYYFFSPAMKFYAKSSENLITRLANLHQKPPFLSKSFLLFSCTGKTQYLCKSSAKNKEQNQTFLPFKFQTIGSQLV